MSRHFRNSYVKYQLITNLAIRHFRQQHLGSAIGIFWAFFEPLIFTVILYTVFTIGLRAHPNSGIPFSVYLISGLSAWLFIANTLNSSPNILRQYTQIINSSTLSSIYIPLINIIGNIIPHIPFLFLAIAVAWLEGFAPSLYTLQVIYYLLGSTALLLGLSWITSSTNLFTSDISKITSIVTQFGFWLTPVFWSIDSLPEKYQWLAKLNPIYYIVSGYRDSITGARVFWDRPVETIYFWLFIAATLFTGRYIFKKLEPHIGDVI